MPKRGRLKESSIVASLLVVLFLASSISSLGAVGSSILHISHVPGLKGVSAQGGGGCVGGTNPSITVDSSYSNPGSVVSVDGTGFSSCDTSISVSFAGVSGTLVATPTSACDPNGGDFICSFIVPENSGAPCYIGAYEEGTCALNTQGITATGNTGDSASQPYAIAAGMGIYPSSGPVGTAVTVYGDGFFTYDVLSVVEFNGAAYVCGDLAGVGCRSSTNPSGEGCLPWKYGTLNGWTACTFTIPQEPVGTYSVHVQAYTFGDIPDGGGYDATFQVTTYSAAASVSPGDAPVGGSITVSASGFPPSDSVADVELNSVPLQTTSGTYGCPLTSGAIDCSVTVPAYWPSGTAVAPGPYSLSVQSFPSGVTTAPITFWVSGSFPLQVSPQSAVPGSTITVSGNAFDSSDTSVAVTFNGQDVASSCPLSSGSFSCQFVLPITSSTGTYELQATGNTAGDTDSATLTVLAGILTNPLAAAPGSSVSVQGIGFSTSDSHVTLELNGTTNVTPSGGCPVSSGSFGCDFTVPQDSGGTYILSATGSTSGDSYSTGFVISGGILLEPSSGGPGSNVSVIGSGFSSSDGSITLTFGGSTVTPTSPCSATAGSFLCAFIVPEDDGGNYVVTAMGSTGDSFSATFYIVPSISLSQSVLDPSNEGSTIDVQGSGFSTSDASVSLTFFGLYYGGNNVTPSTGCSVSGGEFSCSFTLPSPYSAGSFTVEASGNSAGDKANASLTEVGEVSDSPSIVQANSSREIDMVGTGFTFSDYYVTLAVDGVALRGSNLCQIEEGNFNCQLPVPTTVIPGYYDLVATGSSGDVATTTVAIFGISTNVTFGQAGELISVTGGAFSKSDTGASLSFGTTNITPSGGCPVVGGAFECQVNVPSSLPGGNYSIAAVGDPDLDSASTTFDLLTIQLSTSSGPVGSLVLFSGAGFGESSGESQIQPFAPISVLFQGVEVSDSITGSSGSFAGAFYVPLSGANDVVTFSDATGETISTSFQVTNINSYDEIQTTFSGGTASTSSSITGVSITITGSTASDGNTISFQTASLSSYPFTPTPQYLLDINYYAVSWPQDGLPNTGNALVCISSTNPADSLEYLSINYTESTETWTTASGVSVAGGQICGSVPISSIEYAPGEASEVGYLVTGVGLNSTATNLSCAHPILVSTSTSCTATVSGASGIISGEAITFSKVSGLGNVSFSSTTCDLSSVGSCSVNATGMSTGVAIIEALYQGDSNNLPSSGTFSLTISAINSLPPTPIVQGNVIWYTPNDHGFQYIYPASVAINGKQFSSTFYESLLAQYELVSGTPYAGYYSGTFGAISGCQPGSNITITATIGGVTQSATGTCPSFGATFSISFVFGTPPGSTQNVQSEAAALVPNSHDFVEFTARESLSFL